MTIHPSLNALIALLGDTGAQRFLTFAKPQIQQTKHDLLTSLQQQDWKTAAAIAHRFKATAHLYSSSILQQQLENIAAQQITDLPQDNLIPLLLAEFQRIEMEIDDYLNK